MANKMTASRSKVDLKSIFDPLGYSIAVKAVNENPATSYRLRQRIEEDARVDPVDALADAELLVELAKVRLREVFEQSLDTAPKGKL